MHALEEAIGAQEVYNQALRRMLTNDPEYTSEAVRHLGEEPKVGSADPVQKNTADSLLRQKMKGQKSAGKTAFPPLPSSYEMRGKADLGDIDFFTPVRGSFVRGMNEDKGHYGIDIVAPKGSPIKAILDGIVVSADWTLETGNSIVIQHSHELLSMYKHNSVLLKKAGSYVKRGEAIAIIGNTGTSTSGPHLHFELWHQGHPVNPTDYLRF